MALVDTSVWIELFADRPLPQVEILESLVEEKADICICGIILTEVLQGIRREREYKKTKELFNNLIFLPIEKHSGLKSFKLKKGRETR